MCKDEPTCERGARVLRKVVQVFNAISPRDFCDLSLTSMLAGRIAFPHKIANRDLKARIPLQRFELEFYRRAVVQRMPLHIDEEKFGDSPGRRQRDRCKNDGELATFGDS